MAAAPAGYMIGEEQSLARQLSLLKQKADPHQRGYDFQRFVARLLQTEHFRVEPKATPAKPRQVDLFASRGDEAYLIETKWRSDPANIDDVDSLFTRLDAVPNSVIGILISYEGFTSQVLDRVVEKSQRQVLLVSGQEIEAVVRRDNSFLQLLHRKREALLTYRRVLLDEAPESHAAVPAVTLKDFPLSPTEFLFLDGSRSATLTSGGEFGKMTFVSEIPDIDWIASGGYGVTLDLVIPIWQQKELLASLVRLAELGWVSDRGSWSIQQMTTNWHGVGSRSLYQAIRGWQKRYKGLRTHDTEELCYFDFFDEGWYTLTAAISADSRRIVRHVELSFQLVGIPLDTQPLNELCRQLGVRDPVYFRPRNEPSVKRDRPPKETGRPLVTPVAYVIDKSEPRHGDNDEWVVGLVIENPFRSNDQYKPYKVPDWVPNMVHDSEFLVCNLRSWHTVDRIKQTYQLWEIESAWTSDALVIRPVVDWPYDDDGLSSIVSATDVIDHDFEPMIIFDKDDTSEISK